MHWIWTVEPKNTIFNDVPAAVTGSGYIASAVERGIISGFPDKSYKPGDPVTRGQMAIFLDRAFTLSKGKNNTFTDVASGMQAYQAILNVSASGIASGYPDDTYRPGIPVTRGQFSAFMARTLEPSFRSKPGMDVKFLDVGQGDAILIEYPNGKNALIDAGRSDSVIDAALKAEGIKKIDTFIATHPDADHIGGAEFVIKNYGVTKVIDSGQIHTTQTYQAYLDAIDASGAKFEVAEIGDNVSDDSNASATVLAVESDATDSNEGSIVIMLTYGLTDFLLTGDAGLEVEEFLMAGYDDLEAEILKVSHHGSATGTSGDFIEAVSPQDAILSYGDNAYGHPHNEVVQDLLNYDANLYSTHEQGTIEVNTIGNSYTINVDPWRNGNKPTPAPAPAPNQPKPTPKPVEPEYQTSNNLKITAKNLKTDVVTIKNTGSTDVKMKGWKLVSVTGNQTFNFPDNFVLKAGASVNITAGPKAVDNPPKSLKWTGSYIWNNSGDAAKLVDPYGKVINQLN